VKFWARLDSGRELDLDVRVTSEHLEVETGERTLAADVAPLPDGEVWSLLVDGRVHEVAVEEQAGTVLVTLHGRGHRVVVGHPVEKTLREVRRHAPATGGEEVISPIPGLVVALKVSPGEAVRPGQAVAVVEAMKMQNELAARTGGIVRTIHVRERQNVEAGQVLVSLEPLG
jgi:biotin carboxyl carrier protein